MVDGPFCVAAGFGVWHLLSVANVAQNQKNALLEQEEREYDHRREEMLKGVAMYERICHGQSGTTPPRSLTKEKIIDTSETVAPKGDTSMPKFDFAVCSFVCAVIFELLSRSNLGEVAWAMVTPVTFVGLLTIFIALNNIIREHQSDEQSSSKK